MRRDLADITEEVGNRVRTSGMNHVMVSGSYREGFRLPGSDRDTMFWPTDHLVFWNVSQFQFYNIHRKTLILCDCSESPPGFALLQLLTPKLPIILSCITMKGKPFISSSKYRQFMCSTIFPKSTIHGPCGSGSIGNLEYDEAHCFACDFWPPSASSWIDRCHSWPKPNIIDDIVQNGCHFVAIGHKLGNQEDNEWRISFSLAEQKLVCAMNHCQFIIYGLLKLFLKEVINNGLSDEGKLLCSYHMKTTVFWVIQQNTIPHWCPQNFLECFWICLKLILKFVYEGVCPNFFIPQNNMFLSKVYGKAQRNLFIRLYRLYEEGLECLLHSFSISSHIVNALDSPTLLISTDKHTLISEMEFDVEIFRELYHRGASYPHDLHSCMMHLHVIEKLIASPLKQYQVVMLQKLTSTILQRTAYILHNMYITTGVNKGIYIIDKMSCHMLKLSAKYGCISDMSYIAMYYYKTFRYTKALSVTENIKAKLAQPYVMYNFTGDANLYTEAVGGQSWSTKMRQAVAWEVGLENFSCYINELIPEHISGLRNMEPLLIIPPSILVHMLEVLCYRNTNKKRGQKALKDLVHYIQRQPLCLQCGDISWQILGICQQVTGNFQAALYSYQRSLYQMPYNKIQTATIIRIIIAIYRLFNAF
ncbi:uncharacterized protein LOC133197057 [Saccostrea echinata]|uniref:uncharacterized protein LOC133197057 n=1 Tax=Saccostrea echinata TaxID=191078 RepID=UPI002A8094BC|nr:uncharacterized protein LOC133197057 [Saccostrea echinata]